MDKSGRVHARFPSDLKVEVYSGPVGGVRIGEGVLLDLSLSGCLLRVRGLLKTGSTYRLHLKWQEGALDLPGGSAVLREGLTRWIASAESESTLKEIAARLTRQEGGRSLGEVLEESGQLQTYRTLGTEALVARMAQVVATPAFAAWLQTVMAP